MTTYVNRRDAGKVLVEFLRSFANRKDTIVLALPRGGVPVAYEIAAALKLPLDVFVVRKLGAPNQPELAMGAIASGGVTVINKDVCRSLEVTAFEMQEVSEKEEAELLRREKAYRGDRPYPVLMGKIIILVDDGIATGASMQVAIKALRQSDVASIIVAVPVAPQSVNDEFSKLADEFVCPLLPSHFQAVGSWYQDFSQTEDDEVKMLLAAINN